MMNPKVVVDRLKRAGKRNGYLKKENVHLRHEIHEEGVIVIVIHKDHRLTRIVAWIEIEMAYTDPIYAAQVYLLETLRNVPEEPDENPCKNYRFGGSDASS